MSDKMASAIGRWLGGAAAALVLASCGGGGGGSQLAGIDRLGVSSGTITGLGSIFVNGVEWELAGATITEDGEARAESDLKVGKVVVVRGRLDASGTGGTAESVEFDNSVEGPIDAGSIDLVAGRFTVLGQVVQVSTDTEFDAGIPDRSGDGVLGLEDLASPDFVEVAGYRDGAGVVQATRIELRAGGTGEVELHGVVSGLSGTTFSIGSLDVDFSSATEVPAGLANGDFVEVHGTVNGGVLVASRVELEQSVSADVGEEGEIEGYVTDLVKTGSSTAQFKVNGVPVTVNGATGYERGSYDDLANGLKLEAKGEFDSSGVLVAEEIEIRVQPGEADTGIEGNLASKTQNPDGTYTLTVAGMEVSILVNEATRFENASLAGLVVGNHLEIRGAENALTAAANDIIATRIEREDPSGRVVLRGRVQAEDISSLVILGVDVRTDDVTTTFAGYATAAQFYAAIAGNDDIVKVTNTGAFAPVAGNIFPADVAEVTRIQ